LDRELYSDLSVDIGWVAVEADPDHQYATNRSLSRFKDPVRAILSCRKSA
jgi:hypothetical protein